MIHLEVNRPCLIRLFVHKSPTPRLSWQTRPPMYRRRNLHQLYGLHPLRVRTARAKRIPQSATATQVRSTDNDSERSPLA